MRPWRLSIIAALIVAACSATTESPPPPSTASHVPIVTPAATVSRSHQFATASAQPSATGGPTGTVAAPTATVAATPPDALTVALQRALDDWRQVSHAPAAVVGLRLPKGRTAIVASGQANEVTAAGLSTADRFRIGSITKT